MDHVWDGDRSCSCGADIHYQQSLWNADIAFYHHVADDAYHYLVMQGPVGPGTVLDLDVARLMELPTVVAKD